MGIPQATLGGFVIGIILFFVLLRLGIIDRWIEWVDNRGAE